MESSNLIEVDTHDGVFHVRPQYDLVRFAKQLEKERSDVRLYVDVVHPDTPRLDQLSDEILNNDKSASSMLSLMLIGATHARTKGKLQFLLKGNDNTVRNLAPDIEKLLQDMVLRWKFNIYKNL